MTDDQSAPARPTVADHLWQVLAHLGCREVFGLPGITTLPPMEALRRAGRLRYVVTRHEQCAGHMADAVSRMGRVPGVVLVDLGPGLANTLTAVLAAMRDSSPLLVIAGNEERALLGREVWHEMPEIETFRAVTRFCERVTDSAAFPRLLESALRAATGGRRGPALLSVPKDLWDQPVPARPYPRVSASLPQPDPADIAEAAELLSRAQRPLVVAGGGARHRHALDGVRNLCEAWQLPLVTSPNGRGALPEDHPLCLGHAGRFGQVQASETLREADLLLVLGCRLDDLTTNNWQLLSATQKIVQVDVQADMIGRNQPVDLAVVGDASGFAAQLATARGTERTSFWDLRPRAAERLARRAAFYDIADPVVVKPQAVMRALETQASSRHTVVMGGGRFQQFAGEWLVRHPDDFFYAANSGTVGFALSAAIGAAVACPDRQVICVLGDGDFMMHCQELETAVRERAAVKVVILNDFAYGAMRARQPAVFGTAYGNPDFAELARVFGAAGRVLANGNEVGGAVAWLLEQKGAALLDVRIDLAENRSLLFGHDIGDKKA